jgi:hypothetical protein
MFRVVFWDILPCKFHDTLATIVLGPEMCATSGLLFVVAYIVQVTMLELILELLVWQDLL